MRERFRVWRREPLALFLLLGVSVFVVDRVVNGAPAALDEASHIVITAAQQAALREAFRAERGREPNAAEIQERMDRWIDEQVLYREALSLNLDRTDMIVHRQMTQKMQLLLEDTTPLSTPSDTELETFLEQHAQHYGHADTISFDHVFLSRGRHGDRLEAQAASVGAQLARAPNQFIGLGDAFPVGQTITAADPVRLRREFGVGFSEATHKLTQGEWSKPILSGFGVHFVRVTARSDFHPAMLADVRDQVRVDYQIAQRERLSHETLKRLKKKYRIEIARAPA